jgi:hypothetical protein
VSPLPRNFDVSPKLPIYIPRYESKICALLSHFRLSSSCSIVHLHQRRGALPVVGREASRLFSFLVRVWLLAELLDSAEISVCAQIFRMRCVVPPLVHLALLVRLEVGVALKELCALGAVVLPQARQIFYGLRISELCQMLLVVQVGVDLVEVARVAARLLLGGFSSDGRHGGRFVLGAGCWLHPRPFGSGREDVEGAGWAGPCGGLQARKFGAPERKLAVSSG